MAAPGSKNAPPVVLVCGDDEFAVKQRAKLVYETWCSEGQGLDHEIIDAAAGNASEAITALGRLREALQTLPFFGGNKAIWFQNCSFLGEERAASTQAVTENLAELAQELKAFDWDKVRLLISAGKVDKRKTFYKTLEKLGSVETFTALSVDDKDWAGMTEQAARDSLRSWDKTISEEALARLVALVGPNSRQLHSETEKLALYVGDREQIETGDVEAIVSRNKQSRAFALGDALGERNLPKALRCLDEELWEAKRDTQKSVIGTLYGVITKVRTMIFLKEMVREGWLRPDMDYNRLKTALSRVPVEAMPEDKKFNPLSMNPFVLYKAMGHASRYSLAELTRAMDLLLECNQRLVLSRLDEAMVLQQTFLKIISPSEKAHVG